MTAPTAQPDPDQPEDHTEGEVGPAPLARTPGWAVFAATLAVVGVAVIIGVAASASGRNDADVPIEPVDLAPVEHTVLYEIEGTTDWADVTMSTPTGIQQISPDVPMTRKNGEPGFEITVDPGEFVYVSAQNQRGYGTVSCRISVDGVVIAQNESSGGYAIVTCEGTAR